MAWAGIGPTGRVCPRARLTPGRESPPGGYERARSAPCAAGDALPRCRQPPRHRPGPASPPPRRPKSPLSPRRRRRPLTRPPPTRAPRTAPSPPRSMARLRRRRSTPTSSSACAPASSSMTSRSAARSTSSCTGTRTTPNTCERAFGRADLYLYHIVTELEARGMPLELALLPVVESAFEPYAYSRASASGLWQFIPGTGSRYGLQAGLVVRRPARRRRVDTRRARLPAVAAR